MLFRFHAKTDCDTLIQDFVLFRDSAEGYLLWA